MGKAQGSAMELVADAKLQEKLLADTVDADGGGAIASTRPMSGRSNNRVAPAPPLPPLPGMKLVVKSSTFSASNTRVAGALTDC